jgi:hypothetical protein
MLCKFGVGHARRVARHRTSSVMCLPLADSLSPVFVLWVVGGTCQAVGMLLFPTTFRRIYVRSKRHWGSHFDPTSPMLSDTGLRLGGVLTAALVAFAIFMMRRHTGRSGT